MRSQTGTTTLRALVYFDEIFGYLPPVAIPASKQPMLRMLKQARAFGVGPVLVTQNPVDVDYKALSNAGTWIIGKAPNDQDKQRPARRIGQRRCGGPRPGGIRRIISGHWKTGHRSLLHNVNNKESMLEQTRWAMNYLTGPLTRTQIPTSICWQVPLYRLHSLPPLLLRRQSLRETSTSQPGSSQIFAAAPVTGSAGTSASGFTSTRPAIPEEIGEYFLPNNLTITQAFKAAGRDMSPTTLSQGLIYRAVILGQASARLVNMKYKLDIDITRARFGRQPRPEGDRTLG